ncbi:MAG: hypothetical protein KDD70_07080 [Bdellovibrionales bacterium]|nr:hypothetical protein [Bdellovibrionales bacterium]
MQRLWVVQLLRIFSLPFLAIVLSSCAISSLSSHYQGPEPRSQELLDYYSHQNSYDWYEESPQEHHNRVSISRVLLRSSYGSVVLDYYAHEKQTDDLVLVFPMLGGRMELATHFAGYLARFGVDAVIIHRDNDFKNPQNFRHFEEVVRRDIILNRIVVDYFQDHHGKKDFGTFGISRGAISAALAAGVDDRLQYNVFALGGSDIVGLFKDSDERKIRRYVNQAVAAEGIDEATFYTQFGEQIKSDPKYLAKHIDAKHTLMILGVFDSTVPIKYGEEFRTALGDPETIYLPTGHRTSGLYTQYISLVPPAADPGLGLFPVDYLESETLDFFRRSFGHSGFDLKLMLMRIIQSPINLIVDLFE